MGYGNPGVPQFLFCYVGVITLLVPIVTAQFKWKVGPWSACNKNGCGYGGVQTRSVWCYDTRRNSRESDRKCFYLPRKPENVQTCSKPCEGSTLEVKWGESPWSDCRSTANDGGCSRARGIKTREVNCYYNGRSDIQPESLCFSFLQTKPETEQSCEFHCPQNCIVSEFSAWSSCDGCRLRNSTRTRRVVVAPENGGKPCPPLSEHRPCGNCSNANFLKFSKWSECSTLKDKISPSLPTHPLIGAQQRVFDCIDMQGNAQDRMKCVGKFESVTINQACIISQDCILGEWTAWDILDSSCVDVRGHIYRGQMRRTRPVKQIPLGNGEPCDILEDFSEVSSDTNRHCPRTQWVVTDWSKCRQVDGLQQCSTGLEQRKAICVQRNEDNQLKPIDNSECPQQQMLTSRTCKAECQLDCTVTLWSQWSECKVTDCDSYARKRRANKKTGQRYRTRSVLTHRGKGGHACPHLSETQNCDPEPCYVWNITTGPCNLLYSPHQENCGIGEARRAIGCIDRNGDRVTESLCAELHDKPATTVQCNVACENACVLSDWGKWTECPDICEQDQNGRSSRGSQKRTRTILAKAPPGGSKCPPKRDLEERRNCPTVIECATYMWHSGPWGDCLLPEKSMKCGMGIQEREVGCYNSDKQPESDEKCTLKVRPTTRRPCTLPCPRDCVLTEFSDWSPCSATCIENNPNKVYIPTKMRRRHVLKYPAHGGKPCPDLLTEQEKCLDLIPCNKYRWETSPWSQCVLPREACGQGLKAREVTCRSGTNTTSIMNHSIDICLTNVGQMPLISEPCYVSCNDECLFTEWSEWSPCLNGCGTKRFRDRKLKATSNPKLMLPNRCYNRLLYPIYEQDVCHCKEFLKMPMGQWSQCILKPDVGNDQGGLLRPFSRYGNRGRRNITKSVAAGMGDTCGTGKKYRVVACKADNSLETADKCTIADYEEDDCSEPCPVDCEMSDWTEWSPCPTTCGAGKQSRTRHITRLPSKGGRQCPNLDSSSKETTTRLCHPECKQHVWKTFDWTMCIPIRGECGNGTQSRPVSCVIINANGYTIGIESDMSRCPVKERPSSSRECRQPCDGDCVITEWSEWSVCQQPCNYNQMQRRTRKIMRDSRPDAVQCPYLLDETRQCTKGYNCMEYTWELAPWSSCLVNNGMDDCGVGHKERYPMCKTGKRTVDDRICMKVLGPITQPLVVSCEIPCDVDCLLSPWSEWSSCSKTCGLGETLRDRFVVKRNIGNGRECTDNLQQVKHCFEGGCYRWRVSDWSPCMPQPNLCGYGMQTRNISCIGDDGLPADPTKCEANVNILVSKTEQLCHVPCPGEHVLSEWTEWTTCFLLCSEFNRGITSGQRSRSRAVLSYSSYRTSEIDKLWERQKCITDICTQFNWITTPWDTGSRTVMCQMSTGTEKEIVIGGCDITEKPPSILKCKQNCLHIGAKCVDTDTCECESGTPEYDTQNTLIRCVTNSSLETGSLATEADGKSNVWMYAVVAVATFFIIFVAVAVYNMSEFLKKGPRVKEEQEKDQIDDIDGVPNIHSADTITREKAAAATGGEKCTVCNTIPAPVDTMVTVTKNGRLETTVTDDVGPYDTAWEHKSFIRTLSGFLQTSLPCMKNSYDLHVHDISNETNEKVAFLEPEVLPNRTSNAYTSFDEVDLNVQEDLQLLVHNPSYYLAVQDQPGVVSIQYDINRDSKVLTLPIRHLEEEEDVKCESVTTTESGCQSSYRSRDIPLKRYYSDSAISIPYSNSTSASSYTNSPHPNAHGEDIARRRFDFRHSKKFSKDSNNSFKKSSINEDDELPLMCTYDMNKTEACGEDRPTSDDQKGSMTTFMEDCFEKIKSLPRDNENFETFKEFLKISSADDPSSSSESDEENELTWNHMTNPAQSDEANYVDTRCISRNMAVAENISLDDHTLPTVLHFSNQTSVDSTCNAGGSDLSDSLIHNEPIKSDLTKSNKLLTNAFMKHNVSLGEDDKKGYCYIVSPEDNESCANRCDVMNDVSVAERQTRSLHNRKCDRLQRQTKIDEDSRSKTQASKLENHTDFVRNIQDSTLNVENNSNIVDPEFNVEHSSNGTVPMQDLRQSNRQNARVHSRAHNSAGQRVIVPPSNQYVDTDFSKTTLV